MAKRTNPVAWGLVVLVGLLLSGAASRKETVLEPQWVLRGHKGAAGWLAWSPNGQRLASLGATDRILRIWELQTEKQIREVRGHQGSFLSLCWTTQGLLTVLDRQKDVLLWNTTLGKPISTLRHFEAVTVSWSPKGKRLAGSFGSGGVWEFAGGEPHSHDIGALAAGLELSPDGNRLAVNSGYADLTIRDAATGKVLKELHRSELGWDFGKPIRPVAWSPDGKRLAATDYRTPEPDDVVRVWDVATGKVLVSVPPGEDVLGKGEIQAIAWSPDGKQLGYCREDDKGICVWDLSMRKGRLLFSHSDPLSLAWSPEGKRLAAGCVDGRIVVWEVRA